MIFAVYGLAFASILLIFMGLAARVRTIVEQTGAAVLTSNALTDSPVGFLIRPVSVLNRRNSLEPYCAQIESKLIEAGRPRADISFHPAHFAQDDLSVQILALLIDPLQNLE